MRFRCAEYSAWDHIHKVTGQVLLPPAGTQEDGFPRRVIPFNKGAPYLRLGRQTVLGASTP